MKLSALSGTALAFRPSPMMDDPLVKPGGLVRVATGSVSIYSQPSDESVILYQRYRDDLINVYFEMESEHGPDYNPIWYRVWRGYVHSAYLQPVKEDYNPIQYQIPEEGQISEVTVPLTQSYRYTKNNGWEPLYRLYYRSTHWVIGIDEGPDGSPWYRIKDEYLNISYFVPAAHIRLIPASELEPISPDVPGRLKRVEVSITHQKLTAFEDDTIVLERKISSGRPYKPKNEISWNTPKGTFHIQSKMPSKHMGDGRITSDIDAYELPGVPWVCFFEPETGVATHGTYWHRNYGMTMSHGCVNMTPDDSKWLYRWTTPVATADSWETRGYGTRVIVY